MQGNYVINPFSMLITCVRSTVSVTYIGMQVFIVLWDLKREAYVTYVIHTKMVTVYILV